MKRIHITLVGAQPAPIYNAIVAINPDKIIYIHSNSDSSIRAVNLLKEVVNVDSDQIELDTTLPSKIKLCAESLAKIYSNEEITINISSGLKSWAYWFSVVFHSYSNASVLYIDQNNILWDYRTMQSSNIINFDMHTLFKLYGHSIENNYTPFEEYTFEDFSAITKIEEIRQFNIKLFNQLTTTLTKEQSHKITHNKTGEIVINNSYVKWDKITSTIQISLSKGDKYKKCTLSSPHVTQLLFNANWFELKVAKLLSGWSKSKEVCLNCKFPFNKNIDKNEVDIIINAGNKLLFVECKTQITSTTDIDKFRSVIKNYGGMGSKGLFVTDAPMRELAKTKCEEHNIISYSLKENHFNLSEEEALYFLLDNEIDNINAK